MSTAYPVTLLSLAKIRLDGGTQSRIALDQSVIDDYAEAMDNQAKFPAVVVFHDGIDYWLAHGFHRVSAAEKSGRTRIEAEIRPGSLTDAQWYSFGVNKTHGLRRSNEDKRRAVEGALEHELGRERSDGVIAEHCGVTQEYVSKVRRHLASTQNNSESNIRVGKDGRSYNINKFKEINKKPTTTTTSETTTHKTVVETPTAAGEGEPKRAYMLEGDDAVEVVRDKLGRVVPEQYAAAFRVMPSVLNEIRQHLIQAQHVWKAFEERAKAEQVNVGPSYWDWKREVEGLKQVVFNLGKDLPYSLCVYCKNRESDCHSCGGSGWITEADYQSAPEEIRVAGSPTFAEFQKKHGYAAA